MDLILSASVLDLLEQVQKWVYSGLRTFDRVLGTVEEFGTPRFVLLVIATVVLIASVHWWVQRGYLGLALHSLGRLRARVGRWLV